MNDHAPESSDVDDETRAQPEESPLAESQSSGDDGEPEAVETAPESGVPEARDADPVWRRLATVAGRGRALVRAHPKRWGFGGLAVVVGLAGMVTWFATPSESTEVENVVTEYLTAIKDKNVSKAREMSEDVSGADTQLLKTKAIDSNWTIESVESEEGNEHFSTSVLATIAASNGDKASHRFELEREYGKDDPGPWELSGGLATLSFASGPVDAVDVNGQRVTVGEPNGGDVKTFALFPGVYSFSKSLGKYVDIEPRTRALMPDDHRTRVDGQEVKDDQIGNMTKPLLLNDTGEKAAQELVNDRFDKCAKETELITPGCPFGAEYIPVPGDPDSAFDELNDLKWKVVDYPKITVVESEGEFVIADRKRGVMELTGTGERDDGAAVDVEYECEARTTTLRFGLDKGDEPRVFPEGEDTSEGVDPDPMSWSTCGS